MSKNQNSKPAASSKPAFKPSPTSSVVDPNGVVLGTVQYLEPTTEADPKPAGWADLDKKEAEVKAASKKTPSRFVRTLEEQVAAYVADLKLSKVPADFEAFVAWSKAHPPVEKVTAPAGDSATGKVWAYCDQLVASKSPVSRKAVIEALSAQGLNAATISTQFQRWSKARGA